MTMYNVSVKLSPLEQQTTPEQVQECFEHKHRYVTLYIGSSDPLSLLQDAVPQGQDVTSVTGGCEYPLALLQSQPNSLRLCDLSPVATAMAEIKLQCLRLLDSEDFLRIWDTRKGVAINKTEAFQRHILPLLSAAARLCADVLSDPTACAGLAHDIARRDAFAVHRKGPCHTIQKYQALQSIARETAITLHQGHLLDLAIPPPQSTHTLYISNAGIMHDRTCHLATRLADAGWPRVLYSASDGAEDELGTKLFQPKDGTWQKNDRTQHWKSYEVFHDCSIDVLGYQEGAEFPILVECTPKKK
jgi:hypothetical protein